MWLCTYVEWKSCVISPNLIELKIQTVYLGACGGGGGGGLEGLTRELGLI